MLDGLEGVENKEAVVGECDEPNKEARNALWDSL
jgi:hypothetical protein